MEDDFTNEKGNCGKEVSEKELLDIVKGYDAGDYGLFNATVEDMDQGALLEQYKLFLQTSEDLVSRRQNVNNFYISISSALIAIMGVILAMDFDYFSEMIIGLACCVVGLILSVSWAKSLSCYGNLNSSKMKIISSIEKQLPLSLFDAEWAALSDKLNKKKYVSFTESEQIIPRLFGLLYLLVIIFIIAAFFIR